MKLARNIILASIAAVAASCSDDTLPGTNPDNGERTPLNVAVALSNGTPLSRAEGNTFATNDELVARIRQVEWNGTNTDYILGVSEKAADQSPRLVLFKVTSDAMSPTEDTNTQQTSNLTASSYWTGSDWLSITGGKLYWDDFSTSTNPLTADGRYLQSAWGFCYNGGTPTTALDKTNGTIGWTASADFTPNGVLRKNDLLWSKAQKPLKYVRGTFGGNDHGTLEIPYTHAMSMITIEITAGDGFAATGAFDLTEVKLQAMWEKAVFTAPSATVGSQENAREVKMSKNEMAGNKYVFQALVIPGKQLTAGNVLANITNIDGNNYQIPITAEILSPEKWGAKLDEGKLMPGVHYKLTVGVAKQGIDVVAQITNWTVVNAEGTGIIVFDPDVTTEQTNTLKGTFDLYRSTSTAGLGSLAFATLCSYADPEWSCNPAIYWENSSTSYYFRALATLSGDQLTRLGENTFGTEQGKDIVWALPKDYAADAAVAPRTGKVPLQFEHAMSKITINLSTSTTGKVSPSDDEKARAVNLTGATLTISGQNTTGTVNIADGEITPSTPGTLAGSEADDNATADKVETTVARSIVIPQSLDGVKLTITLGDGTTYSLLLKDCKVKDSADNYITTWNRGTHYVYEIYVEKEAIRFVAVIKEWEKVNGSGDANLDWD